MIACGTLIPTKVNAASLILLTTDSLEKKTGELIKFSVELDPNGGDNTDVGVLTFKSIFYDDYDGDELSLNKVDRLVNEEDNIIRNTRTIAELTFRVLNPKPDGDPDFRNIKVYYELPDVEGKMKLGEVSGSAFDVVPVPEPLTIFGTATALGCGVLFKRKSSKKTVS
jgi:hypothetical protein